ncbi:MAG: 50S ribosomal protein L6 [Alphaproteobacteria bacterium]|nr:50S ribosomal protein L6 [Alphaproteobacteria bacterium]NDC55827.1 50S ribosomal protein L6 [Alphaproteobacteria bacterium]NDG03745.1 50S ribosomal protein L6 [Alphaproteobacteria bacterium]
MSRVGKNPVALPSGVTAEIKGQSFSVKGKTGSLNITLPDEIDVKVEGSSIVLAPKAKTQRHIMLWGTTKRNIQSMVTGVSVGFSKRLEIEGVGFKAAVQGKDLVLNLGFSHEIRYPVPEGITIKAEKPTTLLISGADKQRVGQVASEIRGYKKPEPYKGKGIKYEGEWIQRKEGKKK